MLHMPKKRDIYESFLLQGLAPEMSCFIAMGLLYSVAKLTLGAIYYNDCSLEPRLLAYLLGSGSLLVLYLPVISTQGEAALGAKLYLRLLTLVQFIGLLLGTCLLCSVYFARQFGDDTDPKTCNGVIFKFTGSAIALEWIYIAVTLFARGFVTIVFNCIVVVFKIVLKNLATLFGR